MSSMIPPFTAAGTRMSAEERRASILIASVPLFSKKGFEGTTTKEIADAANVSEALLYRHFRSKEDIYAGIQNMICSRSDDVVKYFASLPHETESLVYILYFVLQMINGREDESNLIESAIPRLFLMSLLEDGSFIKSFREVKFDPMIQVIDQLIPVAKESGHFVEGSNLNANEILWHTYNIASGMRMHSIPGDIHDYKVDRDTRIQHSFEFVMRGIGLTEDFIRSLDQNLLKEQFSAFCDQ